MAGMSGGLASSVEGMGQYQHQESFFTFIIPSNHFNNPMSTKVGSAKPDDPNKALKPVGGRRARLSWPYPSPPQLCRRYIVWVATTSLWYLQVFSLLIQQERWASSYLGLPGSARDALSTSENYSAKPSGWQTWEGAIWPSPKWRWRRVLGGQFKSFQKSKKNSSQKNAGALTVTTGLPERPRIAMETAHFFFYGAGT